MTKFLPAAVFLAFTAATIVLADDPAPPPATSRPSKQALADAQKACAADVKTLCPDVQPGGGRLLACLKEHKESVSQGCKQAIMAARQSSN